MIKLATLSLLMTSTLQAATIAIIDSGIDVAHPYLNSKIWVNQSEHLNNVDDDENGLVDDFYGWNFADNNPSPIDYKYRSSYTPDVKRYFELSAKASRGDLTQEEITWLRGKFTEQKFMTDMNIYGNYMHGTHVAGISARETFAKVMTIKYLPTAPSEEAIRTLAEVASDIAVKKSADKFTPIPDELKKELAIFILEMAKQSGQHLATVSSYVGSNGARIANGSFGAGFPQALGLIEAILAQVLPDFQFDPKELAPFAQYYLIMVAKYDELALQASPKTLFVFAAGNDGLDNDIFGSTPSNVLAENKISVAATLGRSELAEFSNFGVKNVEVAAPGVAILSSVPDNGFLQVSGTSQAAPYVTNAANRILEKNSKLTPAEVKAILMGTVDYKPFLVGKVSTGGIVNKVRATKAAQLSLTMSVANAIAKSRTLVADEVDPNKGGAPLLQPRKEFVLPLPSSLRF